MAFVEGCPHVRGGLYEWFHCSTNYYNMVHNISPLILPHRYKKVTSVSTQNALAVSQRKSTCHATGVTWDSVFVKVSQTEQIKKGLSPMPS